MYARVVFMHLAGTPGCETMDSMLSLSSESGSSDEDGDEES